MQAGVAFIQSYFSSFDFFYIFFRFFAECNTQGKLLTLLVVLSCPFLSRENFYHQFGNFRKKQADKVHIGNVLFPEGFRPSNEGSCGADAILGSTGL